MVLIPPCARANDLCWYMLSTCVSHLSVYTLWSVPDRWWHVFARKLQLHCHPALCLHSEWSQPMLCEMDSPRQDTTGRTLLPTVWRNSVRCTAWSPQITHFFQKFSLFSWHKNCNVPVTYTRLWLNLCPITFLRMKNHRISLQFIEQLLWAKYLVWVLLFAFLSMCAGDREGVTGTAG